MRVSIFGFEVVIKKQTDLEKFRGEEVEDVVDRLDKQGPEA